MLRVVVVHEVYDRLLLVGGVALALGCFTSNSRTAIGRAPTSMTIEVNGTNATRSGELYYRALTASNSSAPVWQQVVTRDSDNDPNVTNYFWYDPATLNPDYDEDGNLENDGRWVYTWDAENRLIQMETTTAATTAGHPYTKLVFKYDWQGRRLARTVYRGGPSAHESTRRWLYGGWNPILECSATSETATSVTRLNILTWGLDLSGNLRDAGGVGGLLAQIAVSGGAVYRTSYDGNGNVMAWTKSDQSAPQWKSEYDAFGNPLVSEGTSPSDYEFSTKIRDPYTGLSYYGYRYYDPVTGRWSSRDPLWEDGGNNLYCFNFNATTSTFDRMGLEPIPVDGGFGFTGFRVMNDAGEIESQDGFFGDMAGGRDNPNVGQGSTGKDLLDHLQKLSQKNCCIRTLRLGSHGGENGLGGGEGVNEQRSGFYRNTTQALGYTTEALGLTPSQALLERGAAYAGVTLDEFRRQIEGRTSIEVPDESDRLPGARDLNDIQKLINEGKIVFCEPCKIYIHACNQGDRFTSELSKVTGCNVIYTRGYCTAESGYSVDRQWNGANGGFHEVTPAGKITSLGPKIKPPSIR